MLAKRGYVRCSSGLCGPRSWMLALMVFGFLVSLGHAQEHQRTLSVTIDGSGTVSGEGNSVLCPDKCSVDFEVGDQIVLIATPDVGFRFAEWGGACSGTTDDLYGGHDTGPVGDCHFQRSSTRLTAGAERTGSMGNASYLNGPIIVISTPDGIYCPPDCSEEYDRETEVTLTAAHLDPEVRF